jgi:prepilin-type N-terminal cleavage/methylation domain-containing protein/prepilin-type processing-associated H-X9-DG protein
MPRSTPRPDTGRFAFTLIELLVVIAIVALLAGILFPVFAQAREKARQSTCTSNLRQIGMAVMQYRDDNDGVYPAAFHYPVGGGYVHWCAAILGYLKNEDVFRCPDSVRRDTFAGDDAVMPGMQRLTRGEIGYGWYWWVFTGSGSNQAAMGGYMWDTNPASMNSVATEVNVPRPAETLMVTCYSRFFSENTPTMHACSFDSHQSHIHGGDKEGSVFAYADGHVKFHTAKFLQKNLHLATREAD